jgi:hypothetical protein
MGIFDIFRGKPKRDDELSPVKIEFTAEELDAMQRTAERYSSVAKAISGGGDGALYMPKEDIDKIHAQGLSEYVDGLLDHLNYLQETDNLSSQLLEQIRDKALSVILKAYTMHRMPLYLFRAGVLLESAGSKSEALRFFRLFLERQKAFVPDHLEISLIRQMFFDVDEAVNIATQKVH